MNQSNIDSIFPFLRYSAEHDALCAPAVKKNDEIRSELIDWLAHDMIKDISLGLICLTPCCIIIELSIRYL